MSNLATTIKRLKVLERDWPEGYMLFAGGSGSNLVLCKGHPEDGGKAIETFEIPADGGDPDWENDTDTEKNLVRFAPPRPRFVG